MDHQNSRPHRRRENTMTDEQTFKAALRSQFHSLMVHDEGMNEALDKLAEESPLCAPESMTTLDVLMEEVFGEMPQAEYVDDEGNPVYSVQQLESWLGHAIDSRDLVPIQQRHPSPVNIYRMQSTTNETQRIPLA
jgi:hypothetical protein